MEKRLSDGAEALFAYAAFRSFADGRRDGLIADDLLSVLEEADSEFIAELVEAGRWEEVSGGYQMVNQRLLEAFSRHFDG